MTQQTTANHGGKSHTSISMMWVVAIIALLLGACRSAVPEPVIEPSATLVPTLTATQLPPTATSTATPTPTDTPMPTPTPFGGGSGRLAVALELEEDHFQLALFDVESAGLTVLADFDSYPQFSWSPDGESIVLAAELEGRRGVFVIDVETQEPRTILEGDFYAPEWAPDGETIALSSKTSIYLVSPDGNRLDTLVEDRVYPRGPVWSPDGSQIAFVQGIFANAEIFTIDLNTRQLTQLTDNNVQDTDPIWSPDGRLIAYWSWSNGSSFHIVDLEGNETFGERYGNNIAYTWLDDVVILANSTIDRVSAPGLTLLSPDGEIQGFIEFPSPMKFIFELQASPDGQWIAFYATEYSDAAGFFASVFIISRDGGQFIELSGEEFGGSLMRPRWQPSP